MKNLSAMILLLLCIGGNAFAAQGPHQNAQAVFVIATDTISCNGISISNAAGTAVVNSSATVVFSSMSAIGVYVENEDSSATIFCNEKPGVATSGPARGKKILAGAWASWVIPFWEQWYCISNGAAATNAMICINR